MTDAELPISCARYPDESVYSLLLRSVTGNGLNLAWLRRALGLADKAPIMAHHARQLAQITQAPLSWLTYALPGRIPGHSYAVTYAGKAFIFRNHLRLRRPQVCPVCLHRHGYCRQTWDISLSTICLLHQSTLIDRCQRCAQPLQWDRASIDVCKCGAYIEGDANLDAQCYDQLSELQILIEHHFQKRPVEAVALNTNLPRFLAHLSLDALLTVINAFGTLPSALAVTPNGFRLRAHSTDQWKSIAQRAISRLKQLTDDSMASSTLDQVVIEATLRRLVIAPIEVQDAVVVNDLLQRIFGHGLEGHMQGKYPELSQLRLL